MRIIFHIDMDSFFTSIEARERPELKGKPVVVGADPKGGHGRGVVSTASYEARKSGIKSAMPISQAYKLNPGSVFLPVNMPLYVDVSEQIMARLAPYGGKFEQVSIDEAYLDVSSEGSLDSALELAAKIQSDNLENEGLSCSIGVAPNKLVAKIASDFRKPSGLTVIEPSQVSLFLKGLSVIKVPGIGPKTALKLVKQHKSDFNALFEEVKWSYFFDFRWNEVYYLIKKMPTTDDYELNWGDISGEAIFKFLVDEHDFSGERVSATLEKLKKASVQKQQRSLGDF